MKTKCCSTCKNKQIRTTDEPCNTCITEYSYNGVLPSYTPRMTNADRIRSMTDDELAELLYAHKCVDCILFSHDCKVEETLGSGKTCDERILDWLREEAD